MFVGEAAALGLGVDIPILVRSLADCLSMTTSGPSLKYHESMRAILDNGLPADDPCALVPDYACAWWNDEDENDADNFLSFNSLSMFLNDKMLSSSGSASSFHQAQITFCRSKTWPGYWLSMEPIS